MGERLDRVLVSRGLARSRSQAQEMISSGRVKVSGTQVKKPAFEISQEEQLKVEIEIDHDLRDRFVSRAGAKLEGALEKLGLDIQGFSVLDIGMSTGGFTDCVLQRGAKQVIGIDVGHHQADAKLVEDSRVTIIEGLNARELRQSGVSECFPSDGFDLVVFDVSFISLELVFSEAVSFLKKGGYALALVKPQFELNRSALNKKGIVRDENDYGKVQEKIRKVCEDAEVQVHDYFESPITGRDGNREFFVFGRLQ